MPIKIVVCDDSAKDIEQLTAAIHTYDPFFNIKTYTNVELLIDDLLDSTTTIDILFLDIYMPVINGIQAAQKVRAINKDIKIIFLSSSRDHYPQAYEVFAYNYIVKPLDYKRLFDVLDSALEDLRKVRGYKIHIQYKSTSHNVDCRDIRYIESCDKLLLFHLENEKVLQCYDKLDRMTKELPESYFFRCHQSFIVNFFHVIEMGENCFRVDKAMIGISRKYKKEAKDRYFAFLFSHMRGGKHYE